MKTKKITNIILLCCIFTSSLMIPAYATDSVGSAKNITATTTTGPAVTVATQYNSKENAIALKRNTKEDSVTWKSNRVSYSKVIGEAWFKVYLPQGEQATTLYTDKNVTATVISESNQEIFNGQYGRGHAISQKMNIETSGTYYIKLTPEDNQIPYDFYIMAGEPNYKNAEYECTANTSLRLSGSTGKTNTAYFNLSSQSSIPDGALVRQINIYPGGRMSQWVDVDFYLKPESYATIKLPYTSIFSQDNVGQDFGLINVKQSWSIYFNRTSSYVKSINSVNPTIKLWYCAPDYTSIYE